MTTTVTANIHFDKGDAWHRWNPGDDKQHPYGVLKFGPANDANVFFKDAGQVDEVIAELVALKQEMDPPAPATERQLDVIAALTENDVRAMPGDVLTRAVLDPLDRGQLCSLLRFLAGYEPRGFAKAVLRVADVNFAPSGEGGVLLPAGCDPDMAPALSLTPKGLAALDDAALTPAAPRVIRSAALPGGAA